jgi:hypothetical protein
MKKGMVYLRGGAGGGSRECIGAKHLVFHCSSRLFGGGGVAVLDAGEPQYWGLSSGVVGVGGVCVRVLLDSGESQLTKAVS